MSPGLLGVQRELATSTSLLQLGRVSLRRSISVPLNLPSLARRRCEVVSRTSCTSGLLSDSDRSQSLNPSLVIQQPAVTLNQSLTLSQPQVLHP